MTTAAVTGYAYRPMSTTSIRSRTIESASSSTGSAFKDDLDSNDTTLWDESNWANGVPFNCGWTPDHINFQNGNMTIKLDDQSSSGKPYSSGEYRTKAFYGYGTLEASIKAVSVDGVVGGSLFFYTGPSDGNPWDEIDIEFVKGKLQTNYITNGQGGHETVIDLGFDPSQGFHTYKIDWQPNKITWYVDGNSIRSVDVSQGALPSTPGRIMANLWPGDGSVDGWLGHFNYASSLTVQYDWIKYTPYSSTSEPNQIMKPYNYPNPFPSNTRIKYQLENDSNVTIKIYNVASQLVRTLESGAKSAGVIEESWDGKNDAGENVASGVYFIVIKTDNKKWIINAAKIN
jgi:beta-glucanase (GH16 family)